MNGIPKASMPSANSTRLPPTSARERNTRSGASGAAERASIADEQRDQRGREREQAERLAVGPAGVGRLDDGVDERDERGRDRHRAGDVEPAPALARRGSRAAAPG